MQYSKLLGIWYWASMCRLIIPFAGERHLPGLGKGSRQKMGEEQEEGRNGPESGGDEEAGRCAMPTFCF